MPTNCTFTGQRSEDSDAVGSLMDYGARYYSPLLGRFISADSVVPQPADPQSLNRYSYTRNSPLVRVDPSGHGDCNIHLVRCLPDDAALSHPVSQYAVFNYYHYMFYKSHDYYVAPQHLTRVKNAVYEQKILRGPAPLFRASPVNGPPSPTTNSDIQLYMSAPLPQDLSRPKYSNATMPDYVTIGIGKSIFMNAYGPQAAVSFDNYGNVYIGFGGGIGYSANFLPFAGNISYGYVSGTEFRPGPVSEEKVRSYFAGWSQNVEGGMIVGGGYTTSGSGLIGAQSYAVEFGYYSPQAGYSTSLTVVMIEKSGNIVYLPGFFNLGAK